MKYLTKNISPDYRDLVDETVRSNVNTMLTKHCKDYSIYVQVDSIITTTCNQLCIDTGTNINAITEES